MAELMGEKWPLISHVMLNQLPLQRLKYRTSR